MRIFFLILLFSLLSQAKKMDADVRKQIDACIEIQVEVANCIQEEDLSDGEPRCVSAFTYYSIAVRTGSCKEEWNMNVPTIKEACKKIWLQNPPKKIKQYVLLEKLSITPLQ